MSHVDFSKPETRIVTAQEASVVHDVSMQDKALHEKLQGRSEGRSLPIVRSHVVRSNADIMATSSAQPVLAVHSEAVSPGSCIH